MLNKRSLTKSYSCFSGVMYWMVTGKKPVDATARLRNNPQPRAVDIGDHSLYGKQFLSAIDWALMPDEQQRPQSSEEMLARLRGLPAPRAQMDAPSPADADRTLPLGAPGAATSHIRTVPAPQPASVMVSLDAGQLKEIENELAKRIGPLASVLVRKAAKNNTTIEAVIQAVTGEIDDEEERDAFTRRMKENTRPPASASLQDRTEIATQLAATRFGVDVLDRAEKRLAQHIGAIARVIVKKAAMKARDEGELYLIIADQIEDQNDRKAFIRKAISASKKV